MKECLNRLHVTGGVILGALITAIPLNAYAMTDVTVRVTVMEPPSCVINGNRVIDVDFGEVLINRVDGNNYKQDINYTLECQGGTNKIMKMKVQGTPTYFDGSALQTNIESFGISLLSNGGLARINDWIYFIYPDKPKLQAVPVKNPGAKLSGGQFSAAATLMVNYE